MPTDSYADQTLPEVLGLLADRVFVTCGDADCKDGKLPYFMEGVGWGTIVHEDWKGNPLCGYVLRKPCEHHHASSFKGECYEFNDQTDSIPNAITAMGWNYRTDGTDSRGLAVIIHYFDGTVAARVSPSEGITSLTQALAVAFNRALDNQETKEDN